MFSCEQCQIFKNSFFYRTPPKAASRNRINNFFFQTQKRLDCEIQLMLFEKGFYDFIFLLQYIKIKVERSNHVDKFLQIYGNNLISVLRD